MGKRNLAGNIMMYIFQVFEKVSSGRRIRLDLLGPGKHDKEDFMVIANGSI